MRTSTPIEPSPPPPANAAKLLVLTACCIALVTAVAELVVLAQRKWIQGEFLGTTWHIIWLSPLSYLLFFIPLGVGLALAHRMAPRLIGLRTAIFVLGTAGAFSFFFLFFPALHRIAIVLLAVGAGVQTSRLLMPRLGRLGRAAPRVLAWSLALVLSLGVGSMGWQALRERWAIAALPEPVAGATNVLLIVLDTVRAMSLSVYGSDRLTTPHLERFAERGLLFHNAFAPSPWTLPSHASMFTGYYPIQLDAGWLAPLEGEPLTLAEALANHGYVTGGFVANLQYCTREVGLARGFGHYEDVPLSLGEVLVSSSLGRFIVNNPAFRSAIGFHDIIGRKTARDISDAFLAWADRRGDRPFFAFLNYYDAHEPYLPPAPFDAAFGDPSARNLDLIRQLSPRMAERAQKRSMSEEERRAEEAAYDGAIAYLDWELSRLFDELDRRGLRETTLIVITSDHGELFGEHDLFTHGNSLYAPTLHVPLIVVGPSVPAGGRIDQHVSLRDVPATLMELLGFEKTTLPGHSLAPLMRNPDAPDVGAPSPLLASLEPAPNQPDWFPSTRGSMRSLVLPPYHYIRSGDGAEELYNLTADPNELENLAHEPMLVARPRRALDSLTASIRPVAKTDEP